jgi:hypothetical protein
MRKWTSFTSPLIITFVLLSFGFISTRVEVPDALKVTEPTEVSFPQNKISYYAITIEVPPFLGSTYVGFKEALAFKESSGDYFTTNTLGYLGKYQFGMGTLHLMGVYDASSFINNPELQEKVFQTNIARNKWILRRDIKRFEGKWIKGTKVTESGMLAAAHLAGAGNVKKYLRSYGRYDVKDSYGTNMAKYIRKFSGYDVSNVSPKRNAKI